MKLKYTFVFELEVDHLADYEATTLEEAAKNEQQWINEGSTDVYDLIGGANYVQATVEAIHD